MSTEQLVAMARERLEFGAEHPKIGARTMRPLWLHRPSGMVLAVTFNGRDLRYRLELLDDRALRVLTGPGWVRRPDQRRRPLDVQRSVTLTGDYTSGMAEALCLSWRFGIPVSFPYRKADGSERKVNAVITWGADPSHGHGMVLGGKDKDRGDAHRTYRLDAVQMYVQLLAGEHGAPRWDPALGDYVLPGATDLHAQAPGPR